MENRRYCQGDDCCQVQREVDGSYQKLVFYWLYYGLLGQRRSWNVPVDSVFDWRVAGGHRSISWWSDWVNN
jgi:hypothetical protein